MKKFISNIYNSDFQNYTAAVLLFAGIFLFLIYTGTLNSGYHFIDDHGMLSIKSTLGKESFLKTNIDYVKGDLTIRFRPLYYLYYISEIKIFGINFLKLSIFEGVLAFFTFYFFYIGIRKLGHFFLKSFVFVLLVFVGPQMAIWWRLGTNETIGMFFLGLSFLFMARCLKKDKYKFNNILFIVFLTITSLCKESFVVVVPAFILFKIWNEKKVFQISAKESIKNNSLSVFPVIIIFLELLIIKFIVGTNKIGYAGLTSSASEFFVGIKNIIFGKNSLFDWLKLLGILILIYLISFLFIKENRKQKFIQSLKYLSIYLFFSLMIVPPNIFMHAKTGMFERYLLPTTLGLAFLAIGFWENTRQIFFRGLIILAIFIFILISFNAAKTNAVVFADEGKKTNELLSAITKYAGPNSNILLVADPVDRFEVSDSLKIYLSFKGINDLYGFPITRDYTSDFERSLKQGWMQWFENKHIEDINGQPDIVVFIDKIQSEQFFNQSSVSQLEYHNILGDDSPYAVYIKNNPS